MPSHFLLNLTPSSKSKKINYLYHLYSIFYFIAIFEIIVSLLLMCSLLLYVKRIILFNRQYGRFAFMLGVIFISSNVLAGAINFYLGSGGWSTILQMKYNNNILWCVLFIPYYLVTECLPAAIFAFVMFKYGEIVTGYPGPQ